MTTTTTLPILWPVGTNIGQFLSPQGNREFRLCVCGGMVTAYSYQRVNGAWKRVASKGFPKSQRRAAYDWCQEQAEALAGCPVENLQNNVPGEWSPMFR